MMWTKQLITVFYEKKEVTQSSLIFSFIKIIKLFLGFLISIKTFLKNLPNGLNCTLMKLLKQFIYFTYGRLRVKI